MIVNNLPSNVTMKTGDIKGLIDADLVNTAVVYTEAKLV